MSHSFTSIMPSLKTPLRFCRNPTFGGSREKNNCPDKAMTVRVVLCLFLVLAAPWVANAQATSGSIAGTVGGESGSVIPGGRITVTEVTSGAVRTAATNTDGVYSVPNLPPGTYEMAVSAPGFVTQVWTGVSVAAGVGRVLNPEMQAGNSEQTVRIVAPPALVTETCSTVCGNVSASTVRDTPLNGRDWAQLATLQAGVTGVQASGGNSDRGFGSAISISGSRPDQNSYRLDGISINDYANGAPGSVLGDNLGIDAVEQVSVLGSNYPAEYGRTSGGVINAVTRGGKNAIHGTVYEFLRNSALDARNFFDGPVIPSFRRNQFGASAGMPIRKDRTFVFGDYEGLRQSLGVTTVDTVPSPAARQGQLSAGTVTVDPAVARFLAAFYPLPNPNSPLLGAGDTGIYSFAAQQATTENYFTIRLDHKLSEKDAFSGTYMRDNSQTVQPGTFGELFSNVVSAREVATLHEQHLFSSTLLNAASFGFSRAVGIIGKVSSVINPLMSDPQWIYSIQQIYCLDLFPGRRRRLSDPGNSYSEVRGPGRADAGQPADQQQCKRIFPLQLLAESSNQPATIVCGEYRGHRPRFWNASDAIWRLHSG
jgi:hypothetical protein